MARIRQVKPEFFRHEELFALEQECKLPVRMAFCGLWTICDRDGRFRWRPRQIKLDVMPYDSVDFDSILTALESKRFVVSYIVEGERYGHIPSWKKHQNPHIKEQKSLLPAPCENSACTVQEPEQPKSCTSEYGIRNTDRKTKPSRDKRKSDPRFQATKEFIERCYKHAECVFVWDASESKQLSLMLAAAPALDQQAITQLVQNRFRSKEPTGKRAREWLPHLSTYATGPLDRFNKQEELNGNGKDHVREREDSIIASVQNYAAARSGSRNLDSGGVREIGAGMGSEARRLPSGDISPPISKAHKAGT